MKKNSIWRKVLAVILSAVILIGGFMSNDMFSPVVSAEIINSTTISIGDSITLGTYNNKKMTWTCIAVDDNGALMLASEIICTKEYDASGKSQEYHSESWGYVRENYGSNCWQDSNIRQWLNSFGSVNYSHCSPSYATEKGFLSCFSNEELAYISDTTQKTYVNEWETHRKGYVDGGNKETNDYDISNVENAYYKNLTDKFFLLGQEQIMEGQKNVPNILRIGKEYFTRMANNTGASYENVITIKGSGNDYSVSIDTNGLGYKNATTLCGIRPAFYLKSNNNVQSSEYNLNMPFYLSEQEAKCFIGFLFNTRDLTEEQIKNGNIYAFLTGQLSGENEINAGFSFIDQMDAQLSRTISKYEYGSAKGKEWLLNYLSTKAENMASDILGDILESGIDYLLDEYEKNGGPLVNGQYDYMLDFKMGKIVFDLINIADQVDEYKQMMLAMVGSCLYAGGENRRIMYQYFADTKSNMVYKYDYPEGSYETVMSQYELDETYVALRKIQPILAKWDFLDEHMLLWATDDRIALIEKWAEFSYLVEKRLSQVLQNQSNLNKQITLSFNATGGNEVGSISIDKTGTYGNLPIPTKQGYQFMGWSLTSTNINSTHFVKNTSVYFYAPDGWRSNGAEIYCHLWNTDSKQSLFPWKNENEICEYIGSNIYRYVIPTGSNLNGIIFASSNGFQTYDLALGTICENDVLYCLNRLSDNLYESAWKINTEFKSIRSNVLGTYTLSNGMVDVDNIPVSGYKFVTSNMQVALPKDHTLYAVWEANTYTVSYNMNGGSGSIGNQIKKYGQSLTLSSVIPLRTDYRFVGWSADKNAVTAQYNAGDQYTNNNNITLYAIWRIDHDYTTEIINPTCTLQGYTLHTCKNCNDSYKDTYTNALGHDYQLVNQKFATCTTNGEKIYTCSRCGDTKTEIINATGHSYTTKVIAPTCTERGYTLHTCTNCDNSYKDNYTNVLGHDYKLTSQNSATCTANGKKIYTCSRCGDIKTEIINATGHSYTTKVIAPTCTERGYTLHTCTNCDNSYKDNYTNILGHDYKLTSQNPATCTANGKKIYTCSRCGDIKTEIINATGHGYTTKVVAPTCTEKGYTLHTCKNCNDNYKDTYTNALGHDYKLTSEKAATCTCGDTKSETVKATGHSYTTKVIASTCTEKGYTLHTCSKCGNSYTDNYTNPTGHNYSNPIWTWSENYDEANAILVCTKCNAVHTLNADITSKITEATYEADGKIIYTATVNFNDKVYSDIKTIVIPKKELSSVSITSADFNGNKTTVTVYAETFSAENFTFPATPYFDGYDFKGWTVNGISYTNADYVTDAVVSLVKNGTSVEIKPVYDRKKATYMVHVIKGNLADGSTTHTFRPAEQLYATADNAPENMKFDHWTVSYDDGKSVDVSYNMTYAFRMPAKNITLTAVYVDDSVQTSKKATAYIENITNSVENKLSFTAVMSIPENAEMVQAGIVACKSTDLINGHDEPTIDYSRFNRYNNTTCKEYTTFKYTWTKGNITNTEEIWCVRAYVIYKDKDGNEQEPVYSDMAGAKLSDFTSG